MNVNRLPPFKPIYVELKDVITLDKITVTKAHLDNVHTRYINSYTESYKFKKLPECIHFIKTMGDRYSKFDDTLTLSDKELLVDFLNEHRASVERVYVRREHVLIDEMISHCGLEPFMKPISRYFDVVF